jgi:outer membrane protein assembly factor BamE (lipoprotein component of BamABCDE complex)
MRIQLWLAAVVFVVPGCFISRTIVNEPIRKQQVAKLEPGKSTADDVLTVLGAPTDVVQLGKRSAWRYDHTVSKTSGLWLLIVGVLNVDSQADRAWLFFDEHDVLVHAGATLTAESAAYSFPWEHEHD